MNLKTKKPKNLKTVFPFFCFSVFLLTFLFSVSTYASNLDTLKVHLLKGDYKAAIAEGERLIAKGPHSDELDYLLGLGYLKEGNYARAADIFGAMIKEFSGSRFQEEALLGLGDTYLLRDDFDQAKETYQSIIKKNPKSKLKAQVYYRLSEIGFKQGEVSLGKDYLARLREDYPLAPEAKEGQALCPLEKQNFNFYYSVQIGSFSKSDNAHNLAQKLSASGYPAYIEESSGLSGSKAYRVRVGKLKSHQDAEDLNKKLIEEGYPTRICP